MLITRLITRNTVQAIKNVKYSSPAVRTMSTGSSDTNTILLNEPGNAGVITINRPKALNAINLDMVRQIYSAAKKWENEKSLVIIKGVGDKAFCAGGDVRAVVEGGTSESSKNFFREEYTLNALIGSFKKPYIAIIDGITMGGGVGLSVHGKYRIATERTLFAMPETAIGLFPDVGGGYFLPRLPGKLGLYLGLTGFRLKGKDIQKCGVATHYCDSGNLLEMEQELHNCRNDNDILKVLSKYCPVDNSEFVLQKHLKQINECFSASSVEGIIQKLENDNTEWSQNTLKSLKKMSPTSLKVTYRQLEYGAKLSLPECLIMEFRMAVHHLENSDFKEGVRALLIDKDQKPNWCPATLNAVTNDRVDFFFTKLDDDLKL